MLHRCWHRYPGSRVIVISWGLFSNKNTCFKDSNVCCVSWRILSFLSNAWIYEEPVDGAAGLTRTLLPVSEVPLDILARTHNKTCVAYGDRLPTWQLCRLKGGLRCIIGLTWCNMSSVHIINEVEACSLRCTCWLQHSLPNQTTRAMALCHIHRLVFFKVRFVLLLLLFFCSSCSIMAPSSCNFPRELKHCCHFSISWGDIHILSPFEIKQ